MNSPRNAFTHYLDELASQVLILSSMVHQTLLKAMQGLKIHNHTIADQVIVFDQKVNEKRYQIENEVITLIATQQPAGRDVRLLIAILEIITELERIGDYAKGISKITLLIPEDAVDLVVINELELMADKGLAMLQRALDAFVNHDVALARSIPKEDDEVDALYNEVHHRLIDLVLIDNNFVKMADYLLWAAHNLERLADRVTNICERTVYVYTGEMKELDDIRDN